MQGRDLIGIWDLSGSRDSPPRLFEVEYLESFGWAGNDRLLFAIPSIQIFTTGMTITTGPARRYVVHDLDSGESARLETRAGMLQDIIFIDPTGRFVLLSRLESGEQTPSVHRIDLATREAVLVQPPVRGVWSWFSDGEGAVRVGIDTGERRTRIYYRPTATAPLVRLETRQELLEDGIVELVGFGSNSGRGILGTNAVTGRFAVYEYDFATATRGTALFEHPDVDVTSVITAPDGSVDGFTYDDDRPRIRWINPAMSRIQARLDSTLPGQEQCRREP